MPLEKLIGSFLVNHADNFFAFSASSNDAESVSKALSFGIAGLPGGDFYCETKQAIQVKDSFQMLGCWVSMSKSGELEADPTDANVKEFRKRAGQQRQRAYGRLNAAAGSKSKSLRIRGLQDYLRLESMCQGWVQAFSFCGPLVEIVKGDCEDDLQSLRDTFQISDEETKHLKDASTEIQIKWYSGL